MGKTANSRVYYGGPPPRGGSTTLKGALTVAGFALAGVSLIGLIPGVGQIAQIPLNAASHVIDRMKNGVEASDELKYRAEYYSPQIFKTLGMQVKEGRKATVAEFKAAANINPELNKLYIAPIRKKDKENSNSLMVNAGVSAAGLLVPGGGEVAKVMAETGKVAKAVNGTIHAAKSIVPVLAAGMAGGAIANAVAGDVVDPQEYLEAIHKTVAEAKAKGMNVREVVTPQMIFLLRVSQDPKFAETIKANFKKPFHKMDEAEQTRVMQAYPALANAATSEAYAVAKDMLQVPELGAMKPNLSSNANAYAVGARNSSFADMVTARRAALSQAPAGGIA
jgi:hypothetical protein